MRPQLGGPGCLPVGCGPQCSWAGVWKPNLLDSPGCVFSWITRQASLGRAACEVALFQTPGRFPTALCLPTSLAAAWC